MGQGHEPETPNGVANVSAFAECRIGASIAERTATTEAGAKRGVWQTT